MSEGRFFCGTDARRTRRSRHGTMNSASQELRVLQAMLTLPGPRAAPPKFARIHRSAEGFRRQSANCSLPVTRVRLSSTLPIPALVRWVRDNFGLIAKGSDIESLARTVKDNGGVYFVPAFSGLYAPSWKSRARGVITGLTRYTNRGHLARAVLEATAFQTREVVEVMEKDSGIRLDCATYRFLPFLLAQMLGAMAGAILVWPHFWPHWRETEDPNLKLACFSTRPAIRNFGANLLSEIIGTFVLVVCVATIFSKKVAHGGPAAGLGPYLVGVLVWAVPLSLGGTTGYAINPARDLGPRIMHSILPLGKKVNSGWDYAAVPVLGPLIGAGLAGWFVRLAHL